MKSERVYHALNKYRNPSQEYSGLSERESAVKNMPAANTDTAATGTINCNNSPANTYPIPALITSATEVEIAELIALAKNKTNSDQC